MTDTGQVRHFRPAYTRRKIIQATLVVLLTVGLLAALAAMQILHEGQRRGSYQQALERSVAERTQVQRVQALLQQAESAQRGYVVTGNPRYLEPYKFATGTLPDAIDNLVELTDDEAQRERALQLQELVSERLSHLATDIEERQERGFAAAFDIMGRRAGHDSMEGARAIVREMFETEGRNIRALEAVARRNATAAQAVSISLIGAVLVLVIAASLVGFTYLEGRRRAEQGLREATQRAEQANEYKTNFLASMSHEIRTPLTGILGYADLLLSEQMAARHRGYVERIRVAGENLLTIVNDILDLSGIEAGAIRLEPHPFSVWALTDNVVSILSTLAEKKGLSIHVDVDPQVPAALVGDESRLRQVLLNLMNNAIKFTEHGHVRLTVEVQDLAEDPPWLRFAVSDTGIGIPRDKQGALFKRFSQVESSVSKKYGGTGLGLAICKRLVGLMGGNIDVQSEEGRGATFAFSVPLPVAERLSLEQLDPEPAGTSATGRILLVEDLEQNRDIAAAMLEAAGHLVDTATSGADAVAAVKAADYDLVLMDIQMPDMDGLTATRQIRDLPPPAGSVPIVALTANALPQQVRAYFKAGMNDHVSKPFRRRQLVDTVARWLRADGKSPVPEESGDRLPGEALDEVQRLMGREWVMGGLRDLALHLDELLGDHSDPPAEPGTLARQAHALVSLSATLGFLRFSRLCSELEEAAVSGRDIKAPFRALQEASKSVRRQIEELLDEPAPVAASPPKQQRAQTE